MKPNYLICDMDSNIINFGKEAFIVQETLASNKLLSVNIIFDKDIQENDYDSNAFKHFCSEKCALDYVHNLFSSFQLDIKQNIENGVKK